MYRSRTNFGVKKRFNTNSRNRKFNQKTIDPNKFIKPAKVTLAEDEVITNQFSDFLINDLIKSNLSKQGYKIPTPIQDQAIPLALNGKDIIGVASTGTGKTAAFAIPVINNLINNKDSKALIVAPTRELAEQIQNECRSIGKQSGLLGALLIGGTPMRPQFRDLLAKPNIVIGTPGRILDHVKRGTLILKDFNLVVLDEVDRMLDMGFIEDVKLILESLATNRQSFFFSATLDYKVKTLLETFSSNSVVISLKKSESSDNVAQDIVNYSSREDKITKLHDLLIHPKTTKVIVFDETQRRVEELGGELVNRGFSADTLHGGKSQAQRQRALNRFKNNDVTILVATDVAARGIDVADITHVINYSVPESYESYIHRVGRAGRAGKTGYALTFVANH